MDKLAQHLRALPVPPGDRTRLAAIEKDIDALEERANEKYGAYGLTACGAPD